MPWHKITAAAKSEAPPNCPQCDAIMVASELDSPRTFPKLRVGSPVPPRRPLPVWCCSGCGVRVPRLQDRAA
jgi:hypothetical protein